MKSSTELPLLFQSTYAQNQLSVIKKENIYICIKHFRLCVSSIRYTSAHISAKSAEVSSCMLNVWVGIKILSEARG